MRMQPPSLAIWFISFLLACFLLRSLTCSMCPQIFSLLYLDIMGQVEGERLGLLVVFWPCFSCKHVHEGGNNELCLLVCSMVAP
jgi:hypothetical protein